MRLNTETERFTSTSRYARVSVANFIATLFLSRLNDTGYISLRSCICSQLDAPKFNCVELEHYGFLCQMIRLSTL
jgi:hypothetical protein